MRILIRILRIALIVIVFVIIIFSLRGLIPENKTVNKIIRTTKEKPTQFYPDTDNAPVLELKWDGKLDVKDVTRYTPYGVWEGWFDYEKGTAYEPANEMQFYIKTETDKYLAVAPGIVSQNEQHGESGIFTVRYGRNFAVNYLHIIPDENLKVGQKIEIGDVVGKMEKKPHPDFGEETWWEIQVAEYKKPYIRTVAPYQYFSAKSKKLLDEIVKNSKENNNLWITKTGGDAWTITGGCSWLQYSSDWWSSFSRLGYTPDGAIDQSEEDFIASINPAWQVGDQQGRIIGPKDKCR
ncbi:MAG: hypothetical protein CEN91_158 [Candidatus Berkelbacteria bacterium Licking1014_85]|uniref:Peptidase M23 domain-containing protein n=1 Tax=Candidatus Berkelbacteria bacterium Licking1014_85 TaxID=2017148 RepID=A0A554LLC9_9BACT|nr:MAG: hypothetical protein CEN91_158 [Candidatus Berkelbacteria bacterium Licking1014_85]